MSATVTRVDPPFLAPVTHGDTGVTSQPWTQYHQSVEDRLNAIVANTGTGVTDGSDAKPGQVGEYLTASAATSLASTAITNVVSLSLTAGDWDVSGHVAFVTGSGTLSAVGCGIGGVDVFINATFPPGSTQQQLATAPRRYNVTTATTVWVVAVAYFSGTVTASGAIRARRTR